MNLKARFKKEIIPKMQAKFGYKNHLAVPRLVKVVINSGVGKNAKDKGFVDSVVFSIERISGQKPVLTKAKQSISAFKTRKGMVIGVAVTLRNKRMFDFVEKLVNITFPRIRDFRGISPKQVDNHGNLAVGFKECVAFPEIKADETDNVHGLGVCLSTTAKTYAEGLGLFKLMGFPFNADESEFKKIKKNKKKVN
ncbi:50S ribosomal protein L5 [Candidatus Falkowbacteria bacterium RIFCSPHIGHO2_02_FULL_42_9]|uniref:Large ribosomal subunit protein uL5 n=2 Tax=Candidatus Falkowiibacteriota TaxID=1752728 RepID=A0A1F5S921_9BACT|nr:MAG: 50S ribosomal protein L5 [Candidatus Falkowbacteria bacterium GW2011_GWA2_41_14]OGF23220.1 MAG: 50S ribosomal protein L5 [Candidatus Falkowbacteria bacterium RIFCSPHIGHO2_02_FULL_42_9]